MSYGTLIEGYKRVLTTLYDPTLENYFSRLPDPVQAPEAGPPSSKAQEQERDRCSLHGRSPSPLRRTGSCLFPKFIGKVSKEYPRMLSDAIYLAAMGYHFEKISRQQVANP